ncbi:carbon storage regulator CsrA [Patulibacter minatonensis]|uniref:carbon storage regulator CsrA n=1 Tax=Patulibacter minatonensis TaxID=298163 RepID=UPI00047AACA3|nr:carbon storage regulator CsrA [Patulibacter minatonensis]
MLIVSRREGEKLMIGDDVEITVVEVAGGAVKIGIEAPRSVPVYREELWAAVRDENRAAAGAPATLPQVPKRA